MSNNAASTKDLAPQTRANIWMRKALRGLVGASMLLGTVWAVLALPIASPSTAVAPAAKGISVAVSRTARSAYISALRAQGYELLPTVSPENGG